MPAVQEFFDTLTNSYSYVVWDPATRAAAVIDAVYDFDAPSGRLSEAGLDRIADHVERLDLRVAWILDTHVHADHLSGARRLRERVGGTVCIGAHVPIVQETFAAVFNAEPDFARDGSQFDRLLAEGDRLALGDETIEVIDTPGHTPACVSYRIGDAVFVGDTLFMPDYGTARTDFPGGDPAALYASIQKLLALPESTRLFMCHDYGTATRHEFACATTVAEERDDNVHIGGGRGLDEFVAFRREKDATLAAPKLLYPAVQFNMRGGQLPPAEGNGRHYLKIPVRC